MRLAPAEVSLDAGAVDGVALVVAEAVRDVGDQALARGAGGQRGREAVDQRADAADDLDVAQLAAAADAVGGAGFGARHDGPDGRAVVLDVEPVADVEAGAIIMATGCYERNAGAIQIPGDRPKGVITAGTAQKYLNIHGYLVGKRVVILGSGDIGLIMARRMTLEGAKVLCVCEIMPYSNGLQRNISQCLNDFNIPLYLSHSISKVIGKERVEKVVVSKVDEKFKFIPGTEMEFECDTLLLSIGLIPYVSLLENINCPISSTKGAMVYDNMETFVDGIFACGNCLHVHDVVDFVSEEGRNAGHGAALYLKEKESKSSIDVKFDKLLSYVVPQKVRIPVSEDVTLKFRVRKEIRNSNVIVKCGDEVISSTFKMVMIPSEMVMIKLKKEKLLNIKGELVVEIVEKK